MKLFVTTLVVATVSLLGAVATAEAAPVAVSPAAGAVLTSPTPRFTWALPDGGTVDSIAISRSSKVDANGMLLSGNSSFLNEDATGTSYTMPKGYIFDQGAYYWQVAGADAAGGSAVMPVTRFIAPALIQVIGAREKSETNPSSGMMEAAFYGYVRGNLAKACSITLIVKRGAKRIYSQQRSQDCNGWIKSKIFMNWPNGTVHAGTRVTAQLVVKGGGVTVTSAVMPFRTP